MVFWRRKAVPTQRNDDKLGYLYVLTPIGVKQKMQPTRAFLAEKEREYDLLKRQIAMLQRELSGHSSAPAAPGLGEQER